MINKKIYVLIIFLLISSVYALESGTLKINDVVIPFQENQFEKTFNNLATSLQNQAAPYSPPKFELPPTEELKPTSYIYANNQKIAKVIDNEISFYINDPLGSPRVVIDKIGQVLERIDYLPFGSEMTETTGKIKYNSKELDVDTNLHYYGARFYDASIGRFITPDLVEKFPNPYSYVRNNPLKYIDPTGQQLYEAFGKDPTKTPSIMPDAEVKMKAIANFYKGIGVEVAATALTIVDVGKATYDTVVKGDNPAWIAAAFLPGSISALKKGSRIVKMGPRRFREVSGGGARIFPPGSKIPSSAVTPLAAPEKIANRDYFDILGEIGNIDKAVSIGEKLVDVGQGGAMLKRSAGKALTRLDEINQGLMIKQKRALGAGISKETLEEAADIGKAAHDFVGPLATRASNLRKTANPIRN